MLGGGMALHTSLSVSPNVFKVKVFGGMKRTHDPARTLQLYLFLSDTKLTCINVTLEEPISAKPQSEPVSDRTTARHATGSNQFPKLNSYWSVTTKANIGLYLKYIMCLHYLNSTGRPTCNLKTNINKVNIL